MRSTKLGCPIMVTINMVDEWLTVDAAEEFAQNWIPVSGTDRKTHQVNPVNPVSPSHRSARHFVSTCLHSMTGQREP